MPKACPMPVHKVTSNMTLPMQPCELLQGMLQLCTCSHTTGWRMGQKRMLTLSELAGSAMLDPHNRRLMHHLRSMRTAMRMAMRCLAQTFLSCTCTARIFVVSCLGAVRTWFRRKKARRNPHIQYTIYKIYNARKYRKGARMVGAPK